MFMDCPGECFVSRDRGKVLFTPRGNFVIKVKIFGPVPLANVAVSSKPTRLPAGTGAELF